MADWVKEGELKNLNYNITHCKIARILIRALGKEENENKLSDYKVKADKLGLFKGVSIRYSTVTEKDATVIFENFRAIKNGTSNKGVKEISVEDFMRNPGNLGYELSPDGNYITYASDWESRLNVFVKKMGNDSEPVRVSNVVDRSIAVFSGKTIHYCM